jgi:hypothetical protein
MKYAILLILVAGLAYYLGVASPLKQHFAATTPAPTEDAAAPKVDPPTNPIAPATATAAPVDPAPQPAPVMGTTESTQPASTPPTPPPLDKSPIPTEWTIFGKDYHNVKVVEVLDDKVRITYDGGIGSPYLKDLDPDLRKRLGYDPAKAEAATTAEETARNQAIAQQQAEVAANTPPLVVAVTPTPTPPPFAKPSAPAPHQPPANAAQIQAEIDSLNTDIASKEREVVKNSGLEASHRINSQDGFRDRIAQEQREVTALQAQLAGN